MPLEVKMFEVRDEGTFIPCIGIKIVRNDHALSQENWLIGRAGYGEHGCVLFGSAEGGELRYDPYVWQCFARTIPEAHNYVTNNWNVLVSGAVIDVQFILGETSQSKISERYL